MTLAWAELVPGTVSDVVSRSVRCVADNAPKIVTTIQMEMTMTRRLMTKRVHRSNTLEA
jgi:hypothetical protein